MWPPSIDDFFIRNILFKYRHTNDKITKVTKSYFPLSAPDKTPALIRPSPTPDARATFSGGIPRRYPWDDPWCEVRRRPAFAKIFPLTAPRASPAPKANAALSGSGPGRAKTVEMAKTNKSYEKVKIKKSGKRWISTKLSYNNSWLHLGLCVF